LTSISVKDVLSDNEILRIVRYLGAFKVVEGDLGLFDELSRSRDIDHFISVMNKFLRIKDRVIDKLAKGIDEGKYIAPALSEFKAEGPTIEKVRKIFDIGLETVKRVLELAEKNPRLIATMISSLALAYSGVRPIEIRR